jgi:AcrR family transcriptional regulator
MASHGARDRLLDSAEALLRGHGLRAVSIRRVTAEAGVNVAAVNYEFGSKDELIAGLLERFLEPITRDRLERLEQLERQGSITVESVVRAFLEPLLAAGQEHRTALAELLRHIVAGSAVNLLQVGLEQLAPGVQQFETVLRTVLPSVPHDQLHARVRLSLGATLFYEIAHEPGQIDVVTVDHLVTFLCAALSASPDA